MVLGSSPVTVYSIVVVTITKLYIVLLCLFIKKKKILNQKNKTGVSKTHHRHKHIQNTHKYTYIDEAHT